MSLQNQTNQTNFQLEIPDAGITQNFKFNVQTAAIPGISIPITETPLGSQSLARAQRPGSTIEFEPLTMKFLIDEDLYAWTDLYTWMISINNYMTHESEGWTDGVLPKFITLHILDNAKKNIVLSVHFYNAWPQMMTDLEFDYTTDNDLAITTTVNFAYSHYAIERNGVIIQTRTSIADYAATKGSNNINLHPSIRI